VTQTTVVETSLSGLKLLGRGKVRDIYEVDGKLLLVASDRLSAFDVVMPDGIPGKGKVLTQISVFWFRMLEDIVPNHMISVDVDAFPPAARVHAETLRGRAMLCRKAKPFPVECVVRGYLSGSGWAEYKEKGEVCGIPLPKGLRESDRLPEPIFTRREYEGVLLEGIYEDLAASDPEGVLRHEWVNSRGAIARFDRGALEVRLLDVAINQRGYLRLALPEWTVRHMGNTLAFQELDGKTADGDRAAGISRPRRWRPFRRFLMWVHKRSFDLLYRG